ncbi:hypothetical protein QNF13_004137 [Vibrio vulnificus]|uniref:hypothetical protein n=1 Tax=Vibrio vulnificus TaxID=672 RepID=UPI000CD0C267|nr:hypothetical protein [Vibrio vulnificus]ELV8578779.1 hypothetical protein [Vibrio vulnificus]POB16467.1 hypothetical protein CRN36_19035 [Vibrio vulnificus]HAS6026606.1 hypothetical protein [Vibrio vulnificus]HAS6034621.1 hypothetical protein [Vibrio vulnificus]
MNKSNLVPIGFQNISHVVAGNRYRAKLAESFLAFRAVQSKLFKRIPEEELSISTVSYIRSDMPWANSFEDTTYGCLELSVSCRLWTKRYFLIACGHRDITKKSMFSSEKRTDYVNFFLCGGYVPASPVDKREITSCVYSSGYYESTWNFIEYELEEAIEYALGHIEVDYISSFPTSLEIELN